MNWMKASLQFYYPLFRVSLHIDMVGTILHFHKHLKPILCFFFYLFLSWAWKDRISSIYFLP